MFQLAVILIKAVGTVRQRLPILLCMRVHLFQVMMFLRPTAHQLWSVRLLWGSRRG
jgi:hypothetical protein